MNFTQRRLLKQFQVASWPEWANFIAVDGFTLQVCCYSNKPNMVGGKDYDGFWVTSKGDCAQMGYYESDSSVDWTQSLVTREQAQMLPL